MDRRTFLAVAAGGALFAFSGCSSKYYSGGSFFRKVRKFDEEELKKVAVIDLNRIIWDKGVSEVLDMGIADRDDFPKTLPWYVGPGIHLTQEEFLVRKYANSDLLFVGFGLSERFGDYLSVQTGFDPVKLQHIARKMLKLFSELPPEDFFTIVSMNVEYAKIPKRVFEAFDEKRVFAESLRIVDWLFSRYAEYDGSSPEKVLAESPFYFNGKRYILSVDDYKPYALIASIIELSGEKYYNMDLNETFLRG